MIPAAGVANHSPSNTFRQPEAAALFRDAVVTFEVRDLDRARDFYRDRLGFEPLFHAPPGWSELKAPGGLRLALRQTDAVRPSGASLGLWARDSLERLAAELRSRGIACGAIEDDPAGVRLFRFEDPDGNRLYAWRPSRDET